ncbi:MAG: N-acetylmuramoyl-L-alanine amidase [Planctomycetes bacterium]|nr:N-acetylmuramoyl-L-alanine amidase [Planctomycetota bacterium]
MLAPYALAAVLGGVVTWLCAWALKPAPGPPPPDPLRSSFTNYAWTDQIAPAFPFPPYARFLKDLTIVLDPGHGGRAERAGWKRGPTGLREAEVNLRVARLLRDFLVGAGVNVVLTRDADVYLDPDDSTDLRARITIANKLRADLFLSIHHNASDHSAETNYTSVFYHATPDHSPASLDVARHLLAGLNDALRLEQHLNCGLVSDYAIYPDNGLAVLRAAAVPAVLAESSFHSNPEEEQRLRDPVYNRHEAYGLFLGLARWAQAGLPRVWLVQPDDGRVKPGETIIVGLDDGLSGRGGFGMNLPQIRAGSLLVQFEGRPLRHEFDLAERQVRITPGREMVGRRGHLRVDFANVFGQHVLHPRIELNRQDTKIAKDAKG